MREIDVRKLLGAYATGTLSPAEERRLHEAALDDQQLFDALADEDLLREALEDPVFRNRLRLRLRELIEGSSVGFAAGLAAWFGQPAVLAGAAVAALAAIGTAVLVTIQGPGGALESGARPSGIQESTSDSSSAGREDGLLDRLWESARPTRGAGVELVLDRSGDAPRYAAGDRIRIGFSVPRNANAVLLSRSPDGVITVRFPNQRRSSPLVRAGERVFVPSAGQGYSRVAGPTGRHALRLLVVPPDVDPMQPEAVEGSRPVAVEREYSVVSQ